MFSRLEGDKLSLADLSNDLSDKFGCSITKQAIDGRFSRHAVNLLKLAIAKSLGSKVGSKAERGFLKHFKAVRIQDSTSFQLPKSLAGYYGGCGGAASGSLARIQFEYDLKNMAVTTLELTSGSYQDVSFSQDSIGSIGENELVIRDLGYVSGKFLQGVVKQRAFFLNRLRCKQVVYVRKADGTYSALDFAALLSRMSRDQLPTAELNVFLNAEGELLEMRLIVEKLPDDVYAQRIRKAEREAKKKGRKVSKEYKVRAWLNMYITNVGKEVLKTEDARFVYSLRWQVELIFKSWKSTFSIAKVKPMKKERFESQLYARLLLIIICWDMYRAMNAAASVGAKVHLSVSYCKFNKLLYARLESFLLAIIHRGMWYHRFLANLIRDALGKTQCIEPKKGSVSTMLVFKLIDNIIDIDDVRKEIMA